MKYEIIISTKYKKRKKPLKRIAKKYGLQYRGWGGDRFLCIGEVDQKTYKKLEIICAQKKLKLKLQNQFATRSTNYRQSFFDKHPPVYGNRYFCAYCGCLIHKNNVTIDHLYPVKCVQRSIKMQKKLQRKGWDSINDERNLVAACEYCNKKKSSKMGNWIIKGKLGRYNWLWIIRHIIRMAIIIGLFYFLINCYTT